ncbi:MAG TPA: PEP-CTERM sorting domain-containing protein [Pyrinomonadaceae bacterium]|nr:PEP-CTERM sorting domain-containing protein [Pyrinomonadaceae bacterium]
MRTRPLIFRALPLLLLLLCLAPEAKADPIVITSGFVSFGSQSTFSLQGQGVSISGFTRNIVAADVHAPGDTFRLNRSFGNDPLFPAGAITVGGVTYNSFLFGSDALSLDFQAQNAVIPLGADQQSLVFSVPFTMTGVIFVSTVQSGVPGGVRVPITGSGTVTYTANRVNSPDPNSPWFSTSVTYTFGPAQPVPEPATMLLLGTGLAALAARRRLRKGGR